MMVGTLAQAAETMRGTLTGRDVEFRGVSTDTRTLRPGELFVALQGPNFDGRDFVAVAADKRAAAAVVSAPVDTPLASISVPDTRLALGELAGAWRRQMPARIVGVTGSNGKTTLKEMLRRCLSLEAATLATEGNLNNDIGVPLMLSRLSPEHVYAVLEMGANHAGEIAYLTEMVAPQVVAITNAAAAHLEGFGSIEGVARAKGEILQGTTRPDFAILNADDPYYDLWASMAGDVSIMSFGVCDAADVRATNIRLSASGSRFTLTLADAEIRVSLPLAGLHNVTNAAAAAAVACVLGIDPALIRDGLNTVKPVSGRLRRLPAIADATLFDDSYNANPASVGAAAEFLAAQPGEGWLVLGDMAELGDAAAALHASVGDAARDAGVERLYATGDLSRRAVEAFGDGGYWFDSVDALIDALRSSLAEGGRPNVLVKGSRSMRMERVVAGLEASPEAEHRS